MEKYEITYLCEEGKVVDIKKTLEENQARIEKETDLGVRQLAYPIVKVVRAKYFAIKFELDKANLAKIEKTLRLNKEIVRYLIVKNPPEAPVRTIKPSGKVPEIEKPRVEVETKVKEAEVKTIPVKPVKTIEKIDKPLEIVKEEEPKPQPKTDTVLTKEPVEDKKAEKKIKIKAKPVKIAKDELDEKLKELTLD